MLTRAHLRLETFTLTTFTFQDVREEVLLTSEESVLRTLPPAILAEANALRSRYRDAMRRQQAGLRVPIPIYNPNPYEAAAGGSGR